MLAASSACRNSFAACSAADSPSRPAIRSRISAPLRILASVLLVSAFLSALPSAAQSFTIVHSFSGPDGSSPTAGLLLASDGNFYGVAMQGGANGFGTVFEITPAGTFTTLHNFAQADGSYPAAPLIQGSDGALYSTTSAGGAHNVGTIYRITTAGALTTLHSFSGLDGSNPFGPLLIGPDGNFYGTTTGGGSAYFGTVFQFTPAGALTVMHNFAGQDGPDGEPGNDGGFPYGTLISVGSGYYAGTTGRGGIADNVGVLFTVNLAGDIVEPVLFDKADGSGSFGGLILASDGNAYGLTAGGGTPGPFGEIYQFNLHEPLQASDFSMVTTFGSGGQPYSAYDSLLQGSDGNFYGTSNSDSNYGDGTVFEYNPSSRDLAVLVTFNGSNGSHPYSTLVQGPGGTIWGTTSSGGAHGYGEIFKSTVSSLESKPVPARPITGRPITVSIR
jgi:uncharacterized repeat protein (TIGR03803 family)